MKLNDTVAMMNSENFGDRMRAEYFQLTNRADGLEAMLKKYKDGKLNFTPKCSYELLFEQLIYMRRYQKVLEDRFKTEGIVITNGL